MGMQSMIRMDGGSNRSWGVAQTHPLDSDNRTGESAIGYVCKHVLI